MAVVGLSVVRNGHISLQIDGALHRVDDVAELNHHSVRPWRFVTSCSSTFLRRIFSAASVPASSWLHEPAVADHIGGENGGEAAFHRRLPWQLDARIVKS